MRSYFFLLLFLCGSTQAGVLQSIKLNAASTNIATTYTVSVSANNVSVPNAAYAGVLCWNNQTGGVVAVYVDNDKATTAPSTDLQDIYLPAGQSGCLPPNVRISRSLLVRSDSGAAITSGLVYFYITDRRG